MGTRTLAWDIAERLAELREHLGLTQAEFAELFGRGRKQVSAWETGRQTPPLAVVEWAARRNGWPIEMFQQDGRMPTAVLASLTAPRPHQVRDNGSSYNANGQEGARASDSVTASVPPGPTVEEVRASFAARLAECKAAGKDLPLAEAFVWMDAALRAKRAAGPESVE